MEFGNMKIDEEKEFKDLMECSTYDSAKKILNKNKKLAKKFLTSVIGWKICKGVTGAITPFEGLTRKNLFRVEETLSFCELWLSKTEGLPELDWDYYQVSDLERTNIIHTYNLLRQGGYLEGTLEQWLYMCYGEQINENSKQPLNWLKAKYLLGFLVNVFFEGEANKWKILQRRFQCKGKPLVQVDINSIQQTTNRINKGKKVKSKELEEFLNLLKEGV